ncbi:MAG: hypothetical protein QIT35_gp69 [Methanophagales virus PBV299]|uniref:Uncharacterized protein n=1 Tax=Methanophagales virus PBV299 TaxID=2987730 RepID=A0ABY6GLI0_9CAUD|nr:MAG: hypothetical protein QIT35_gp69 [Methanophagales virus PBV299]UYL64865.1 MAG: hypothetical protein OFDIEDLO_00069 [Methanophagales virus PBV299]
MDTDMDMEIDIEKVAKEVAEIEATIQRMQKLIEKREKLMSRIKEVEERAKKSFKEAGIDVDEVGEYLESIKQLPATVMMPTKASEEMMNLLHEAANKAVDLEVARFFKDIMECITRNEQINKVVEVFNKADLSRVEKLPEASEKYAMINKLVQRAKTHEYITREDVELALHTKVTKRVVRRPRRSTGGVAMVRQLLKERGSVTYEEAIDELVANDIAEDEADAKKKFNSIRYHLTTNGEAEWDGSSLIALDVE